MDGIDENSRVITAVSWAMHQQEAGVESGTGIQIQALQRGVQASKEVP